MSDLRARLAHVYWLGGGTGGGKSTIARRLADRFGLRLYDTGRTSTPERALGNLLERDRMFTDRLTAEVERLGLTGVVVEAGSTEDELADQVAELFGLSGVPKNG